jgi:hypothetical protein
MVTQQRLTPLQQAELLVFNAYGAASQCVNYHNMLAVVEEDCDRLKLVASSGDGSLVSHRVPFTGADAHRMLVSGIQRREVPDHRVSISSPNPVLREEFYRLRGLCEEAIAASLPKWVLEVTERGGVICGSGSNGGLLNTAARVSQQSMVSRDHLDTAAAFHYCGLTDVLIAENYPKAELVIPFAAWCSGLMGALKTPRIHYLPTVTPALAVLTNAAFWSFSRRDSLRAALSKKKWFESPKHRLGTMPRVKGNPASPRGPLQYIGDPMAHEAVARGMR